MIFQRTEKRKSNSVETAQGKGKERKRESNEVLKPYPGGTKGRAEERKEREGKGRERTGIESGE